MPEEPQPLYTPVSAEPSAKIDGATAVQAQTSAIPTQEKSSTIATVAPLTNTKPSKVPHFTPEASGHPVVIEFTTLYNNAITNAKKGNDNEARKQYTDMLKLYSQITTLPNLHDMNKDIAHFCLQDVYDAISEKSDPEVSRMTFGALVGITVLFLIIGGLIVMNPSIVGLVTGLSIGNSGAPQWIGGEPALMITTPTTIKMSDLFSSPNGKSLTYLATSSGTLDAVVDGEYATLVPKYGATGTTRITLIASLTNNPRVMTRMPVDVTVTGR